MTITVVLVVMLAVILGCIPGAIAQRKGHDFVEWWIFGSLLFIVALPMSLATGPPGPPEPPRPAPPEPEPLPAVEVSGKQLAVGLVLLVAVTAGFIALILA